MDRRTRRVYDAVAVRAGGATRKREDGRAALAPLVMGSGGGGVGRREGDAQARRKRRRRFTARDRAQHAGKQDREESRKTSAGALLDVDHVFAFFVALLDVDHACICFLRSSALLHIVDAMLAHAFAASRSPMAPNPRICSVKLYAHAIRLDF